MALIVGENTYISLSEFKLLNLDSGLKLLADEVLEELILKSFDYLELTYNNSFFYKKYHRTQPNIFPLRCHVDGVITKDIKKAQSLIVGYIHYEYEQKDTQKVSQIAVAGLQKTYITNTTNDQILNRFLIQVDSLFLKYQVGRF
jgi:hypothetical protein